MGSEANPCSYGQRLTAARQSVNVVELRYLLVCDQQQDTVTIVALTPYNLLPATSAPSPLMATTRLQNSKISKLL